MSIQRIDCGPRLSDAVIHGQTIYLAGQVAHDTLGKGAGEQTREILAGIDALLARAGSDKTKMLMVNIWLSDIRYYAEMNAAWDVWVPQGHTPARATVEAKLAGPEYLVEIAVVAAK